MKVERLPMSRGEKRIDWMRILSKKEEWIPFFNLLRNNKLVKMRGEYLLVHGKANASPILYIRFCSGEPEFGILDPRTALIRNLFDFFISPHECEIVLPREDVGEEAKVIFAFTSKQEGVSPLTDKKYTRLSQEEYWRLQETTSNFVYLTALSEYYPKFRIEIDLSNGKLKVNNINDEHIMLARLEDRQKGREVSEPNLDEILSRHLNPEGIKLLKHAFEQLSQSADQELN